MWLEIHDRVMNEAIGVEDKEYDNLFDLQYQILKNAKRKWKIDFKGWI